MPKAQRRRRRGRRPDPENAAMIIDRHFLKMISMTINGKPKKVTVLAAIVFRLFQKELAGDAKASAVLLKYQQITKRVIDKSVQLEFAEREDSRSAGFLPPGERNG